MVRILKQILLVVILSLGVERAGAFSPLGRLDVWQTPDIGYGLGGDLGGPQNLGEEYRRNVPVVYYACDANFLGYFGSNGVWAVEQAAALFNEVTNVSVFSPTLDEIPLQPYRINYQAEALSMLDLKTLSTWAFAEQMGLAEPERFMWTLRDRLVGPGGCPADVSYYIVKRNFDPVTSALDQLQTSSYVNGTLYSYQILEFCQPPNPIADAIEFPVDPSAETFTSVASFLGGGFGYGKFVTSLSRDDVGGLRYLMRTNNMNIENAGADTVTFITNPVPQLVFSSNLTLLAEAALTNNAAALAAQFPGLEISSTFSWFTNVVSATTVYILTNYPGDPYGYPPRLIAFPVVTTNIVTHYRHQFANVITNTYFTNGFVSVLTTNVTTSACPPGSPYGLVCSNVTFQTVSRPGVYGDYILLPTNSCGISLLATQLIVNISFTNAPVVATNAVGTTNNAGEFFSQSVVYNFNQYIFQARTVDCPADTVALRQGVNGVRFERREFDSLLGRFFYPVTNDYYLYAITNNTLQPQRVRRVITAPDFLFTTQDSGLTPYVIERFIVGDFFDAANTLPLLNGPGRMVTPVEFRLNKTGPIYLNHPTLFPGSLDEQSQTNFIIWATFDGSTNPPVVYPNGASIEALENQVLIQQSPAGPALPNAAMGVNYGVLFPGFTVAGGTAPYTWSLRWPTALPSGLTLNGATGKITGVPTVAGTYDFTIRMTDSMSRYVDRDYTLIVAP